MSIKPWFDRVLGLSNPLQEALAAAEDVREQQAAKIQVLEADMAQWKAESDTARQQLTDAQQRVTGLEQQLAGKAAALVEAQKENELTLLQLHQVREELESNFLKNREKDEQLQALEGQVAELKREQAAICQARDEALKISADQKQQLASKAAALVEARKENELTLLQLHQVQEELEHYFLQSRAGDELAQAQQQQLRRAQALIARLLPKVATTDQSFELTPVEVLTPQPSRPQLSLQTEALLNSYAASLQRAAALLQRAMNR